MSRQPKLQLQPLHEQNIISQGFARVVGIDEVGRGCWAGPVAVGAFIYSPEQQVIAGVNDSKRLSPLQREIAGQELAQFPHEIFYAPATEIDQMGIAKAIEKLIFTAVEKYSDGNTYFLIDGQFSAKFGADCETVIKGDATYYSIAAAAILAKVARDTLMTSLDLQFPGYAFAAHKGYGTAEHQARLLELGPSAQHRFSYAPIANLARKP